jgi:hypothetical protein
MQSDVEMTLLEPLFKHIVEAYAVLPYKAALEKELSVYLIESARREFGSEHPDMHLIVGALRLARNELSHAPGLHALCQNIELQLEHLPAPRSGPARGFSPAHP